MKLDVLSGPGGFGGGQAVQALVSQGGSLYQANVGITGWPINSFTTLTFNGTFAPGAFTKVSGPGPATPLFDGVTPTSFGFAYGNSQSATLTQYYDNWNIAFAVVVAQGTVSAVPTLSDGTLLLLAVVLLLPLAPASSATSASRVPHYPVGVGHRKPRHRCAVGLRDPRDGNLTVAVLRNRDVGIGVEALLFVTRGAVLIASHPHQDHHEREP